MELEISFVMFDTNCFECAKWRYTREIGNTRRSASKSSVSKTSSVSYCYTSIGKASIKVSSHKETIYDIERNEYSLTILFDKVGTITNYICIHQKNFCVFCRTKYKITFAYHKKFNTQEQYRKRMKRRLHIVLWLIIHHFLSE